MAQGQNAGDARVDAVLSPYDGLSIGILSALRGVGYGTEAMPWPYVTGQDAEIPSIQSIIDGEQASTIFKDTRDLAAAIVRIIEAIMNDTPVPVNNTTDYHNGIFIVPSYLLPVVHVNIDNWKEALIDTGYYTLDQFRLP